MLAASGSGGSYHGVLLFLAAVLVLLQGFLISALGFAMQHECMHLTAFKTRRLNIVLGSICSIPALSFFEHELLMHKGGLHLF
jgi:fatty acid desaturase